MTTDKTLRTEWSFQLQPEAYQSGTDASSGGRELCAAMNALHAVSNCAREREADMAGGRMRAGGVR